MIDPNKNILEQNKLAQRWQSLGPQGGLFTIAETDFGCGVNVLAACDLWLATVPEVSPWRLQIISASESPHCKSDLASKLVDWPQYSGLSKELLAQYPATVSGIHHLELFNGRINLCLMFGDTKSLFKGIAQSSDLGLAKHNTQSVDAWFMQSVDEELGQTIASLSGADTTPAGRVIAENSPITSTPWHLNKIKPIQRQKTVAILGAGIAGCAAAAALHKRGYRVTMVDRHAIAGQEASGNDQAIIYPKLSVRDEPLPRINLTAMMLASRYYRPFWDAGYGKQCGVLVVPENAKIQQDFIDIAERFANQNSLVQLLNNDGLRKISGIAMQAELGLFFPQLGWLPPATICQQLLERNDIPLISADIEQLRQQEGQWQLLNDEGQTVLETEILVVANAYGCEQFKQTHFLPVTQLRGQTSQLAASTSSLDLNTVICGEGYITPAVLGSHSSGASYNKGVFTKELREADHRANVAQMASTDAGLGITIGPQDTASMDGRANYRCTTKDYLPIVGAVPDLSALIHDYDPLRRDARKVIPLMGSYQPNLYVHCGMGSRGLCYAPLTAELLASEIAGEMPPLERDLRLAMHPARFLIRDLKKNRL